MNNDWREYTGDQEYLAHFGVQGMKWGVRRYETASGKLTPAGQARYNTVNGKYQKVKAAKAKANESYMKFNSDWNKAALATVSLSKKKRAEAATLRAKAKASGKEADKDIEDVKKAQTDLKYEKKIQKMDVQEHKILEARSKNRDKIEGKMAKAEAKGNAKKAERMQTKLKDFDEGTKYVKAGYEKYKSVLSDYRDAKISSIGNSGAKKTAEYKSARNAYAKQKISDMYYGNKNVTALGYGVDAAKGARNKIKQEAVLRKTAKTNAVQNTKRNPVVVQSIEKEALKKGYEKVTGNAFSAKAAANKALAGMHNLNAKTYEALGMKSMAALPKAAAKQAERNAQKAQEEANKKRYR